MQQLPCRNCPQLLNRVFGWMLRGFGVMGAFHLRRVLRRSNICHGTLATCCLAFASTYAVAAETLSDESDALPDAAGVVEAYMLAREWVNQFALPAPENPEAQLLIENATGVCVILRSAGRVVGTGTAVVSTHLEPEHILRRAVGRALSEVLGDPAVAAMDNDRRSEIGRTLLIELEVAGPWQPLLGRSFHQFAQQVEPGLEGVAMRRGDARAMLFPARLRATNTAGNLQSLLPGLAADIGLAPAPFAQMQSRHNVSMHRFRTTHLAQDSPSRFPFETFRGDRLVHTHTVGANAIAAFADGLAFHLLGKRWSHDMELGEDAPRALGLKGDYNPVADHYRPIAAPALDQALVSLALMHYARAPGVESERAERAGRVAIELLQDLAHAATAEDDSANDLAASALIIMLLSQHPELLRSDANVEELHRHAMKTVYGMFDVEDGFAVSNQTVSPHTQAMLAATYAMRLLHPDAALKPVDLVFARAAIDAAWRSVPTRDHVSLLPWIGWAEVAYAEAAREPIHHADDLLQLRRILEEGRELQLIDQPADLHGGFALAVGAPTATDLNPPAGRPTAHTSRPAAFFATMLRHSELTPEAELPTAINRHRETMRFLLQLSVRDASTWSMRHANAALGGVRSSVWDARMPNAAQAMSLIAATETLHSLNAIE